MPSTWDVALEDNDAIALVAKDYLVGRGRKNLAFVNLLPEHPSLRHRGRAFADAVQEAGGSVRVVSAAVSADEAVARLLDGVADAPTAAQGAYVPDGLFVPGPDTSVVEIYRALERRGLRPGRELDFVSCNNDPQRLATLDPRLPNIDIQPEAIGRAAAETLLWRLQYPKEPQRRLTVAPVLVEPTPQPS